MIRVAHVATVDITHRFLLIAQLRRLRDEGFDVTAISAPGPFSGDLTAEGIAFVPWPHATRAWSPLRDIRAFAELIGILRRGRFDVVHTHTPKPGLLGRLAGRIAGVPIVVNTVHGYYALPEDPLSRRLPVLALEWIAARFSNLELFQSGEDLSWARRLRLVSRRKSALLGNGTDLSRFDPSAIPPARTAEVRRALGIDPTAPVVGTVGRMVAEKGYLEFFEAARAVRRKLPDVRFLAVGPDDPAKDDAIGGDVVADASGDVTFAGFRTDMPEIFSTLDVFVLASWREGVPRSAIEAAAMGTPLVLTDIRGCREVARSGIEGLLIRRGDAKGLTSAILQLLGDPQLRATMASRARERAVDRFDERRVAEMVVREYRRLLRETGTAARTLDQEGLLDVRIRGARTEDVPSIVRLHMKVIPPTAFLPLLGPGFMSQIFRAHIEDPESVAVVAERNGEIIGYSTGVASLSAFRRRFLVRRGIPAAVAAAPRLAHPRVLRKVLETGRYPEKTRGLPDAEWNFIGVKAGTAWGLGPELGRETLDGLSERGVREVKCYVADDNKVMDWMLRRMGFELVGDVALHEGQPSSVYVMALDAADRRGSAS